MYYFNQQHNPMKSNKKGHFDDPDRYTKQHQNICNWFVENNSDAKLFIRLFLFDNLAEPKVEIDEPIITKTGYLLGYPDILISYQNDQSRQEKVLIEVKTSLADFGEALRQVKTYRTYLGNITKTCLIHAVLDEDKTQKLKSFFGSQGIFVFSWQEIFGLITPECQDCGYLNYLAESKVPAGKRDATFEGISEGNENCFLHFWVAARDEVFCANSGNLFATKNFASRKSEAVQIQRALNCKLSHRQCLMSNEEQIRRECLIELSYQPNRYGEPASALKCLCVNGKTFELGVCKPQIKPS